MSLIKIMTRNSACSPRWHLIPHLMKLKRYIQLPESYKKLNYQIVHSRWYLHTYGNTGCGVFKGGIQNQKGFWLKINCSHMKFIEFCKLV